VKLTVEFASNSQDTIFIKTQKRDTTFNTEFFSAVNNFSINYEGTKFILKANRDSILVKYYIGDIDLHGMKINKSFGADTSFIVNAAFNIYPPLITANLEVNDTCSSYAYNVLNSLSIGSWSEVNIGAAFKFSIISDSALQISPEQDFSHIHNIITIPAKTPYSALDWWDAGAFSNMYIRSQYGGLVRFYLSINGR
jgi:hypothetical protein